MVSDLETCASGFRDRTQVFTQHIYTKIDDVYLFVLISYSLVTSVKKPAPLIYVSKQECSLAKAFERAMKVRMDFYSYHDFTFLSCMSEKIGHMTDMTMFCCTMGHFGSKVCDSEKGVLD